MDIVVCADKLNGRITPPPFKSEVIRVLILSALCGRSPCDVIDQGARLCDDIIAAKHAVEKAFLNFADNEPIYVSASAALIRMFSPLLLFQRGRVCFRCDKQLMRRDMSELQKTIACSIELDHDEQTIVFSGGRLCEEQYTVSAQNSSQFASGMLIAGAVFGFGVRIPSPVSAPYIELTLDCLRRFGCCAEIDNNGFFRLSGQLSAPSRYEFSPDMSYAANYICADMLMERSGSIIIDCPQNCRNLCDAAAAHLFGSDEPNVTNSPDLFPLICVHALKKDRDTVIKGTARLSDKESDRVASVSALIHALGGCMERYDDHVVVQGASGKLRGGCVQSFGDHRIVMAAAIASLMCESSVTIFGAEAVSKSAPGFFDDFCRLGGVVYELVRK
ncbi:MAG: hypothetical protein IKZ82_08405 [Clostridia bacterium]|nr:hypothetical protein [Clostridia bacterium]